MKLPCAVKKSLPKEVDMLVDEVARPQEKFACFRNSPEIHGRAPLLSVLRAAYASDEGSRHLHEERAERAVAYKLVAEPAKLKLGPALPRACSTDSPYQTARAKQKTLG